MIYLLLTQCITGYYPGGRGGRGVIGLGTGGYVRRVNNKSEKIGRVKNEKIAYFQASKAERSQILSPQKRKDGLFYTTKSAYLPSAKSLIFSICKRTIAF